MNKAELLQKVQSKIGAGSIIQDELAPDHVEGDKIEKRYLYINHINSNGTAGKTYVYYLYNTETDDTWFYNTEVEHLDPYEPTTDLVKLNALREYLSTNFDAYFLDREKIDLTNNWAEAIVYTKAANELVKETVLVFKKGTGPVTHLKVV